MTSLVSLEKVCKAYSRGRQRIEVLHDIDLEIEAGEFVSLMGPSGSGKSTLLNLIGGLDRPDSGVVRVDGRDLGRMSNGELTRWRASNVGFIFQFYNLLPVLTAARNVEVPLLLTRLSAKARRARVDAALELVGMRDRARHRPNELSGGQQQRVAIARALISDPGLLVCDEPTGDLDRASSESILELLGVLNADYGKTVLMVTHDPKAAQSASRRLIVDKGSLAGAADSPADVAA